MASQELDSIPGYHNVPNTKARELMQPYMQTDGYYLLRPSSDNKGGVLCTICVTNKSKLINYRLVKDQSGSYYIHGHPPFPSVLLLLNHYKTTPINSEVNTCLLHPVLPPGQKEKKEKKEKPHSDDTYVIMKRTPEETPKQESSNEIPGLHLYLPKGEINIVMAQYLTSNGYYLIRPSATSEGQFTLAVSHAGKVMNFKINFEKNEYFISPRRKFASILELLEAYKNTPIRSKKMSSERILLLHPIPVDKSLEQQHKKLLEDKAARKVIPPVEQDALPSPWQQHMDQRYNKYYYYNPETAETTWERPKAKPETASLTPRRTGRSLSGKQMKDRPLPSVPGQTPPTTHTKRDSRAKDPLPPLPSRQDRPLPQPNIMNGGVTISASPRRRSVKMPLPPLPTKENTSPSQEFPPLPSKDRHPSNAMNMRTRPPMPLPPNFPSSTNSIDRQSVQPDSDIPSNKLPPSRGKMPHNRDTSSKAPPCQGDTPSFPPKSDTFPPAGINSLQPQTSVNGNTYAQEEREAKVTEPIPYPIPSLPKKEVPFAPPLPEKEAPFAPPLPEKEATFAPPLPEKETAFVPPLPEKEAPFVPPLPEKEVPPLPVKETPPLPEKDLSDANGSPPTISVPPPPPVNVPAPPPPPPMVPPPPSPSPARSTSCSIPSSNSSSSHQIDTGSGRPFGADDLQAARTLLRRRADTSASEEPKETTSGFAGVFANAIDSRMMSIRKAVVDSDSESEFEDVDDDEWD